jgi:hypothetical protein
MLTFSRTWMRPAPPALLHVFPRRLLCALASLAALASAGLVFAALPIIPDSARAPVKIKVNGAELYSLGFDKLAAFDYTIVDAGTGATPEQIAAAEKRDQVPAWIYFYQSKRVVLTGYLMPLQLENGLAKKFVLMKDVTTCCYGAVPGMNDYVIVTMKGDGVKAVQDVPVALVGVFHVEQKYENGFVTSLYQLDGEKLLGSGT